MSVRKRILCLRPFRADSDDDHLFVTLATALARIGTIILIGPRSGRLDLERCWKEAGNDPSLLAARIEYVESTSEKWKEVVLHEIEASACVILHLAPKQDKFPSFRWRRNNYPSFARYYKAPFKRISTGAGLLREVTYLDRLGKVQNTVVACRAHEQNHVQRMIRVNSLGITLFAVRGKRLRAAAPRMLGLDHQLAYLGSASAIVAYDESDSRNVNSAFAEEMRTAVKSAIRRGRMTRRATSNLGVSSLPRSCPPDGKLKTISETRVEDLLFIPFGEISEVPQAEARKLLSRRSVHGGCPTCKCIFGQLFFYRYGLAENLDEIIRGKCQNCSEYMQIMNARLIVVGRGSLHSTSRARGWLMMRVRRPRRGPGM